MKIAFKRDCGNVTLSLIGELDHHAAKGVIPEISGIISSELPQKLELDFEHITFMDSSGIAVVISAYKHTIALKCEFAVVNVPKQAYKVFKAAGICNLINISEKNIFTNV